MPTKQELKEQQRNRWSSFSSGWDKQHELLGRQNAGVSEWICREAGIGAGMRVLDLACGSGHPALEIGRLVQPGGSVIATDLVEEMVASTLRHAAEAGIDNLEARVMDAESIDFPDDSFDAVSCEFGLMFCPEPVLAAREVHRVLRSGARFALVVWDEPSKSQNMLVLGEALRRFGHPPEPLNLDAPGVYYLSPPGKLQRVLEEAGFSEIRVESRPQEAAYESFETLWGRALARPGAHMAVIQALSEEEQRRLKAELAEVVKPYTRDGVIRLTSTPLCAAARK